MAPYNNTTSCNNTTTCATSATTPFVYPPLPIEPYDIIKIVLGILSILFNGILLFVIAVERKRLFVSRVSYLVANLSLADFLIGGVIVFILQPIELHERKPEMVELELPFIWVSILVSVLTIFLMSAERFVVAALPMLWSNILTTSRTIIGICIIWCLAIIGGVLIHYRRNETQFALIVIIEVFVVVFIAIHVYIVRYLKKHQTQPEVSDDDDDRTEASPSPTPETTTHTSSSSKQHGEVMTVVAILLVVFIVTILPYFICLQIATAHMTFDNTIIFKLDIETYSLAYFYTNALSYLNFVANPIVYAWRLTMYRKAFTKILHSFFLYLSNLCYSLFN